MCFDDFQNDIQPCKHITENRIGMRLAGIENDVGKHRDDLFEARRLLQKRFVQPFHVRPKLDARHREVALKTLGKIRVKFFVLFIIQFKLIGNMNRIRGCFAIGEERRRRLQSNFMRNHADATLLRHVTRGCFGKELSVEHDHRTRLGLIEKP